MISFLGSRSGDKFVASIVLPDFPSAASEIQAVKLEVLEVFPRIGKRGIKMKCRLHSIY
jgi:hypothetical protein